MQQAPAGQFAPDLPWRVAFHRSWRSMKGWVMAWLWALNVIYWLGLVFLPRPEAVWVLVAYAAVAPLIVVMARRQRGLTRLSGLIHLPWVPLALYLGLRLFTDLLGPALSSADGAAYVLWLQVLFWSTLVCLSADAFDVVRWFAGERFVLGTPAAHAAGASKLAAQN